MIEDKKCYLFGRQKLDFAETDKCKPVLLRLSLAGNMGPNGGSVAMDSVRVYINNLYLHLEYCLKTCTTSVQYVIVQYIYCNCNVQP
jgi:hypothetical protein